MAELHFYDAIVAGGAPAGLAASLYMAREGIETLVIEKAGLGGQAGITQTLDNFPGFDEGIPGAEFAARLGRQARKFGVECLQAKDGTRISKTGASQCQPTESGLGYEAKVWRL